MLLLDTPEIKELCSSETVFSETIIKKPECDSRYALKLLDKMGLKCGIHHNDTPSPFSLAVLAAALAIENAFVYGSSPVKFEIKRFSGGYILSIEDSGEGFDFRKKVSAFLGFLRYIEENNLTESQRARLEKAFYASNLGNGMRYMHASLFKCFFEGRGNIVKMLLLEEKPEP